MRLNELDLTAYGHFSNARLTLPPPANGAPDLHVIYGPNEAGKSTLLAAWLDLLFGFPNVTPYDFLHDKRALRVQAQLRDSTGRIHALARIKGNQNTLLDAASGQPVPENVLAGLLGGLDRAAYGTMFSLNDQTLVEGSKSIMASEGDLGQLLFQGTAGLAELGARLREIRAQADEWFHPRKRKMVLAGHKARLTELTNARKDVDLTLGAWRKLTEAVTQAEALHTSTQEGLRNLLARQSALQRDQDALKTLARLRPIQTRLASLPARRDIPADWRMRLPDWQAEDAALAALVPSAQQELKQAKAALDNAQVDSACLPFLPQIDVLEQRFGAVSKELADQPRRESDLAAVTGQMQALATRLGRRGVDPEALILPAPLVASLTDHMTAAATLSSQRTSAEAEVTRAQDAVTAAQANLPDGADDLTALGPLADLLDQIRSTDPLRALAVADADLRRAKAALDTSLKALNPWQGDARALVDLDLPSIDTLRTVQSDLTKCRDDLRAAKDTQQRLTQAVARGRAGLGDMDLPDTSDLAASRDARETAWAAHKAALSPETAAEFEAAMLANDQQQAQALRAARLFERAETLRADLAELAAATTAVSNAQADWDAAQAQVADLWAKITPDAPRSISDLVDWQAQRVVVLKCLSECDHAQAAYDAANAALQDWDNALTALIPFDGEAGGFAGRMAHAQMTLTKAAGTKQARDTLASATTELRKRCTTRDAILAAQREWQATWQTLLAQAGWDTDPSPDVVQMRAILGALADLPALVTQAADLQHRISRITQDADNFTALIGQMATDLGEAIDPDLRLLWPKLRDRLRRARDGADAQARLVQDYEKAQKQIAALDQRRAILDAATSDLRAAFPEQSLPAVAETISQLAQVNGLHAQADELRADLTALLNTDDLPAEIARLDALDTDELQVEGAALQAALNAQQDALQRAFADLVAARRDRDSVGSDARAAQLDEDRQTLLLQIAAEAHDHLSRHAAMLAVDAALRVYRDTHRSSMMDRAGAAFRVLTAGRYSGLGAQPNGDSEVLIAQEQGGAAKVVDTLSKGTAFQLYLALRIAGYQELADQRPMVPFIADDIMESFDDDRAAAAFGLLGQMAQRGQVIYLTHHAHLCTIARAACPDVRVHDLRAL